jgi:hypothetical protein
MILHLEGGGWENVSSPASGHLYDIGGTSPKNIYAVGRAGGVLRFDGSEWARVTATGITTKTLVGVWVAGDGDLYAVGDGGTVMRGAR